MCAYIKRCYATNSSVKKKSSNCLKFLIRLFSFFKKNCNNTNKLWILFVSTSEIDNHQSFRNSFDYCKKFQQVIQGNTFADKFRFDKICCLITMLQRNEHRSTKICIYLRQKIDNNINYINYLQNLQSICDEGILLICLSEGCPL